MSTILGAESAFTSQTLDKSFMLAQAHEHGEDKKDKSKEKKGKVIKIVTAVVNMEKKLKFMHI